MYGLKEKTIGKLLVRVLRIDKDSEDGFNLLNWKLPGQKASAAMAGDFAGRCYDVIQKRPMRTDPGDMTIAEVNEMLDKLSIASKEEDQAPLFREFYQRMNAEEMLWLIRMILRQMKVGATEKTIFDIWHPDAENLFNVSSSLRRVCWELYDPAIRLNEDDSGISLMQCFQPQLAAFQMHSFEKMVSRMKPTDDDDTFWIEEKLDGERMQLHMIEDSSVAGGFRFNFWSRKAKDYTYLYGSSFGDDNSALTRHLKSAFKDGVRNIILDGEMITWDMEQDA
ncbi:DNA ligase (ATP), partial [Coniosporium uncinatum]